MKYKIYYSLAVVLLILAFTPIYPDGEYLYQIPELPQGSHIQMHELLQGSRFSLIGDLQQDTPYLPITEDEVFCRGCWHTNLPSALDMTSASDSMQVDNSVQNRLHHSQYLFCPNKDITNITVNHCVIGEYMCEDLSDYQTDHVTESNPHIYGYCPAVEFSNGTLNYCPINEYLNIDEQVHRNVISPKQYGICEKGGRNGTVDICMVDEYFIDDQDIKSKVTTLDSLFYNATDMVFNIMKDFSKSAKILITKMWNSVCKPAMNNVVDILQAALNLTVKFVIKQFSNGEHRPMNNAESDSRKMTACVAQCQMRPSELVEGIGEFSPFIDGMYKEPHIAEPCKHTDPLHKFFYTVKDQFVEILTLCDPVIRLTVEVLKITCDFIIKGSVKIFTSIMNSESQARKTRYRECAALCDNTGKCTAKHEKTDQEDQNRVCSTDTMIVFSKIIATCSVVSFVGTVYVLKRYRKQKITNKAIKRKIKRKDLNATPGEFDQGIELEMKFMDYPSHHEYADDVDDFEEIIALFDTEMKINEDNISVDIDNDDDFVSCVDAGEFLAPEERSKDICFNEAAVFSYNPEGLEIYAPEITGEIKKSSGMPKILRRIFGRRAYL